MKEEQWRQAFAAIEEEYIAAKKESASLRAKNQRLMGENGALIALLHDCDGNPRKRSGRTIGLNAEQAMRQALGGGA